LPVRIETPKVPQRIYSQDHEGYLTMTEPVVAQKSPFAIEVEAGKKYFWCSCGKSAKQPFCDGSHAGSDFGPVVFEADTAKTVFFCGCKKSNKQPMCDGTHSSL